LSECPFIGDIPVFNVDFGSNRRTCVSSSETGKCSLPRHDNEFTGPHQFFMVPEFHAQLALHHKKHFVLIVV